MIGSWTDWDLTDFGREQAARIGRKLADELSGRSYIMYASSLLRARRTAEIVAEHLNITPIITDALKERNLGMAVGKSVQWLKENIECQERTVDDRCFHDAESRRDVWKRLLPFHGEIMRNEAENVIVVSHGDTLAIFNAMWLGLNPEFLNQGDLYGSPGGVSFLYETADGKRVIKRLSDMSYTR
jgi:probable phosphoglycerate mutase